MRIAYLLQTDAHTGARSVGKRLGYALAARTGHDVLFMVPDPLDIDHPEVFVTDGDVHIPTVNLATAVEAANIDVIVAHTVTEALYESLPMLNAMRPTLFRYGVNLTESVVDGKEDHLEAFPQWIRGFDAICSPGPHATRKIRGLGIDPRRIYDVPPIPATDTEPVPDLEDRPNAIGVVAGHRPVKDLPFLMRALRIYADDYGDPPEVLLAGATTDGASLAERHAEAVAVDHLITPLGWADPATDVYPNVRAVVMTSVSENSPAVYPEALAAGVPVVAPNAGWAIPPGTYTPDDPAALAAAIRRVLRTSEVTARTQRDNAPDGYDPSEAIREFDRAITETAARTAAFTLRGAA